MGGARTYVVRPVLINADDSDDESHLMAISNIAVKYNSPNGSVELVTGDSSTFAFTAGSDIVITNEIGIQLFEIGDYIIDANVPARAKLITDKDEDELTFTLDEIYAITDTVDDAYKYYPGGVELTGDFIFVHDSNIVEADDADDLDQLVVGDWIYSSTDAPAPGYAATFAKQVVSIDTDAGEITLNAAYTGTAGTTTMYKYTPFQAITQANTRSDADLDPNDADTLWYFYAVGAGAYYNNIYVKCVRNVEFEKIYTDADGNPLYPYAFMNLSVYRENEDGSSTMMEGPWAVSLISKTATNQVIKDIATGKELYIETVVNNNSKIIQCVEGLAAQDLMTADQVYPYAPDSLKRQQIQALLSESTVLKETTVANGGIWLDNGENGDLFNANGTLNFTAEHQGIVAQAYQGTLSSTDGSIEMIIQEIYPRYVFDYIVCGGYNAVIQNSARLLADSRGDCMVLADTGSNTSSADADLTARLNDVGWNTFNAMIYTQYREIFDLHTGKKFYVTPVTLKIAAFRLKSDRIISLIQGISTLDNPESEE